MYYWGFDNTDMNNNNNSNILCVYVSKDVFSHIEIFENKYANRFK